MIPRQAGKLPGLIPMSDTPIKLPIAREDQKNSSPTALWAREARGLIQRSIHDLALLDFLDWMNSPKCLVCFPHLRTDFDAPPRGPLTSHRLKLMLGSAHRLHEHFGGGPVLISQKTSDELCLAQTGRPKSF